jgi:hypothetical protein
MLGLSNKLDSSSTSYQQKEVEVIAKLLLTMINRLKIVDESLDYLKKIEINAYNALGSAVLLKDTEESSNEALAHYEKCVILSEAIEDDECIAKAKYNIAIVKSAYLKLDGKFGEDLLHEAQATYNIYVRQYGEDDVDTLDSGLDVVTALVNNKRVEDAWNLLTKMLATSKQTHGSDHDITKKIRAKMDEFVSSSLLLSGLNIPDNISDLLNNRSPTGPEQIQQTLEQLASLCTSPQVQEIIANPAKMDKILDTMRPSIMTALNEMENSNNVMIKTFLNQMKEQESLELEGGWEALKQSIEDPEQWREMTSEFVEVMRNSGEDDRKDIMAQMSAMRGAGGGMMG